MRGLQSVAVAIIRSADIFLCLIGISHVVRYLSTICRVYRYCSILRLMQLILASEHLDRMDATVDLSPIHKYSRIPSLPHRAYRQEGPLYFPYSEYGSK